MLWFVGMVKEMKLKEGKKYDVEFEWGTLKGAYYAGWCESLLGYRCDHCGRTLENGHIFKEPSTAETSYEDCEEGAYRSSYFLGKTCVRKVNITEVKDTIEHESRAEQKGE